MLLQAIALLFAFSIRKVKIKGLDDTKYIAVLIYVTSLVLAVSIVGTFSLSEYINAFVLIINIGFFIGTSVILLLVFIPLVSYVLIAIFCALSNCLV